MVSTSATGTPPEAASAAKRSSRRAFGSGSGSVTSARSTLTASTWPSVASPGSRRTIEPWRGLMAAIASPSSSSTQSPVTGVSVRRPRAGTSRGSSDSGATSQRPRYCARTRAGVRACNGGSPRHSQKGHDWERAPGASSRGPFRRSWRRCEADCMSGNVTGANRGVQARRHDDRRLPAQRGRSVR